MRYGAHKTPFCAIFRLCVSAGFFQRFSRSRLSREQVLSRIQSFLQNRNEVRSDEIRAAVFQGNVVPCEGWEGLVMGELRTSRGWQRSRVRVGDQRLNLWRRKAAA